METNNHGVHHLFQNQVDENPDAVAVICGEQQLTYRELDQRSNQFAHHLQERGVKLETPVGILLERSLEMVIVIWGIFKAGGTYVPLDLALPRSRLGFVVSDTQMPFVITNSKFADRIPEGIICLEVDREPSNWMKASPHRLNSEITGENLAYIAYTSGSTGNPKGVMIPHRVFTRCAHWGTAYFQFTKNDRFLLNFFRAPEELLFPLLTGATAVLSPPDAERDTALLVKTIRDYQVTVMGLTPSLLNLFLNEPDLEDCPSLRHLYCAGEALPVEVQQRFFARLDARLYNFYGLAEAPFTSIWECKPGDTRTVIPIGLPVDATVCILDKDRLPVEGQTIGEIYIGGPGLARGYLNLPQMTTERFIQLDGARYYYTGDQAYYDGEGQIIFLGRSDHQVQIRGIRVELGEIEGAIRELPSVTDAVVLFLDGKLVAYLTLMPEIAIDVDAWQVFLKSQLPDYMLPFSFVILTDMPLALTGKTDRKALPQPGRNLVSDLRVRSISEADQQRLLVDWNETDSDYPEYTCVHQLFEEQVKRTPDSMAVICEDRQMTYSELNQRANRLAEHLLSHGVEAETLIGICVDRSLEMMIGLLGILKAGAAYVPLDPNNPKKRLEYILDDTKAPVVVTQKHLKDGLPSQLITTVCIEDVERGHSTVVENPNVDVNSRNLAYIMYTSGSTGEPKGVCIEHRSIVRLVTGTNYIDFSQDEVFLHLAPLAFDASTFEIWGALLHGAKLVIFPPYQPSVSDIAGVIKGYQVTTLWLTSGLFDAMVDQGLDGLESVKQLLVGGDVLSKKRVERAFKELHLKRFVNGYGPTEATTFACCHQICEDDSARPSIPIGRPISNTTAYLLDENQRIVPIGEIGELCLGGAGLARGYLNQPELTKEKFVRHPYGDGYIYRTGDRARYFPDGTLEFLGRIDQQIKLRGFRIELGEIENAISEFSDVSQNVVILREDRVTDKRLVAYLVTGPAFDIEALQVYLKSRLPQYMVPAAYVLLDQIPLTPNGKLDRKALREPEYENVGNQVSGPDNVVERLLVQIWKKALNLDEVGVDDDFFAMGGHSLTAMQVINQIRTIFSVSIRLRVLFSNSVIRKLAAEISKSITSEELEQIEKEYLA